jgi:peroxiredoxin
MRPAWLPPTLSERLRCVPVSHRDKASRVRRRTPEALCYRLCWLIASGRLARQEGHGRPLDRHQNAYQAQPVAPLSIGAQSPDFTLPHTPSARIALRRFLGQPVILVFYPLDWEAVSRDQLVLYQKFAPEFELLGARLLGISVDSAYCHAAFARDALLHFPLLADFHPHGQVARRFGGYRDKQGMSARALFVLDRRGKIRFSRAYPDFLNPGVDEALSTLESLAAESGEGERDKEQ